MSRQLRSLLEGGRFAETADVAAAALAECPGDRDALYGLAVAQRMMQRIPEALASLATLERYHPKFSRLHQERGHCFTSMRDAPSAVAAFERAVRLNPALPASWRALCALYRMAGRPQDAEVAGQHVAKLGALPSAVVAARGLLADGDLREAEEVIRPHLAAQARDVEALRILASIARTSEVAVDAAVLLEAVLAIAPDYHAARYDYVQVLADLHRHAEALVEVDRLMAIEPDNQATRITRAGVLVGLGRLEEALACYRVLLAQLPDHHELRQSMGHALKTMGRHSEAVEAYRQAIAIRPAFGEAWWSLANLKTYRFSDAERDRMRLEEARPEAQATDRYHLCFALGKALEDSAMYGESFACYQRGNALKKEECRYTASLTERNAQRQQAVCTTGFFTARTGWGCESRAPIFIVGLPRAGSTLLEQILASHSQIEGTMELAEVPRLVARLGRSADPGVASGPAPQYPGVLATLTAADFSRFGADYLRDTLPYRTGKPRFIDKMPNNFRHVGLLHLMLPNACIIDARREPMACCFSNFKQLFASGQEFTYSLEDIARYYRSYVELMAHWDAVLPGRVLRVQHEALIDDLEAQVRRILDYCGLPFEPACLEFHKTERRVHTASSEQVRQPLNREGVDQWKHYEPWLAPLREALGTP